MQLDLPQFELITPEASESIETVERAVIEKYGLSLSRRLINRQTAEQSDGTVITEETSMTLKPTEKTLDPVCRMEINPAEAAGTSEYQGRTYYFCASGCKQRFDHNPQEYSDKR